MSDEQIANETTDEANESATALTPEPPAEAADEPLGDAGKRALQSERERANRLEKEHKQALAKLKEIEDRDLSELEKAQRAAKEYGDELAALKARALRNEVALAKGIPAELAGRLQGETEEELAADADKLLALVGTPKRTLQPDKGQGARETSAEADADAEYRKYFPTD